MKPSGKIIQISSCAPAETQWTQCEAILFALCADGSVWFTDNRQGFANWFPAKAGSETEGGGK